MKKLPSIMIFALSALLLLSTLIACGESAETTSTAVEASTSTVPSGPSTYIGPAMELSINLSSMENMAQIYTDAFNRISERTGGKVTFVFYYSSSLMSSKEALDGLGTGLADISDVTLTNFPDQFVYTQQVTSYPFLGFTSLAMASEVMNDVVFDNQLMMGEFEAANITPVFFIGVWGTSMVLKNNIEISSPDDVRGLKLISQDPTLSKFLSDKGATPVDQGPGEYYNSMSNNLVDGIINGLYVINMFGGLQPAKNVYMFENSFTTGCRAICVNTDKWNEFDDTLKQLFMEEFQGEEFWNSAVAYWTALDQTHLDDAAEWNIPVNKIDGELMQAWKDAIKPYGDTALKGLSDKGYTEVYDVLDFWEKAIESYSGAQ